MVGDSTPTRTGMRGLGNHCSILLSYRVEQGSLRGYGNPKKIQTFVWSKSKGRNFLVAQKHKTPAKRQAKRGLNQIRVIL